MPPQYRAVRSRFFGNYSRVYFNVDDPVAAHYPDKRQEDGGFYAIIDRNGNAVASEPPGYDAMMGEEPPDSGYFEGRIADLYQYRDGDGNALPQHYGLVSDYQQGRALVIQDRQYRLIDRDGNILQTLPYELPDFTWMDTEYLPLLPIRQNGLYGYITRRGEAVIPPQYDYARKFSQGYARVRRDGKYGLIDRTGRATIPLQSDELDYHNLGDGLLYYCKGWHPCGIIDLNGREITPPRYLESLYFNRGGASTRLPDTDGKRIFGVSVLVDRDGCPVAYCPFDERLL